MGRRYSRKVNIGGMVIGGGERVAVQSMTNTDTSDVEATISQIRQLSGAGCDIVRVAVPDIKAAEALKDIKGAVDIPVVADIHFDYRLAMLSIKNGADKIRINPGNIGSRQRVEEVAGAAGEAGIPIRVGVNSGSLGKEILERHGGVTAEAMVESALENIKVLKDAGFNDIVVSLKASDVQLSIEACRLMAKSCDYPLHLGVTEAGTAFSGTVKSSIGIGSLLADGIGDTIRVSLTGDPVQEVKVGREILKSLGLIAGPRLISCPTCGRCRIDLESVAAEVEKILSGINKDIKVAVMGCAVNGPGEAREADVGVAGGNGCAVLFKKGKALRKIPEKSIVEELTKEIDRL